MRLSTIALIFAIRKLCRDTLRKLPSGCVSTFRMVCRPGLSLLFSSSSSFDYLLRSISPKFPCDNSLEKIKGGNWVTAFTLALRNLFLRYQLAPHFQKLPLITWPPASTIPTRSTRSPKVMQTTCRALSLAVSELGLTGKKERSELAKFP